MPSRNVTMGGTRWVTPGAARKQPTYLPNYKAAPLQVTLACNDFFAFFRVLLRLFLFQFPPIPASSDAGVRFSGLPVRRGGRNKSVQRKPYLASVLP
jgi:hypothetical protein